MNDGYFAFKQQSYKKLTNLERAQIKRSNERYSNTCITDLPKRLMFGFRVLETILSGYHFFHNWECIVR